MAIVRAGVDSLAVYSFPRLTQAGARHAVSTRHGGSSSAPFTSLNLGFSVGDDAAAVQQNRIRFYRAVGAPVGDVVTCSQVHSTTVAAVGDDERGSGALSAYGAIPVTDALITNCAGVYLFLRFADCVPVLLCDPARKVVALAHAGWKGTVGNIVGETVRAMTRRFGCDPTGVLAAVAPAIGPCHYVIQEDVARPVRAALPFWPDVLCRNAAGDLTLDLPGANRRLLHAAGLPDENIMAAELCTACHNDDFYSHRAEKGCTGRFGVLIGWVGDGH